MLTSAVPLDIAGIPDELRADRAWCVWRYEERDGKPTKVPSHPDGRAFRSNDHTTWATFVEAVAAHARGGSDGIGRAITGDLVGVDVDWKRAIDVPDAGPPWLAEFLAVLDSWTELSPSGRGCHVWLRGVWSSRVRQRPLKPAGCGVEVYDRTSPRYFTLTGATRPGCSASIRSGQEAQVALDALAARLETLAGLRKSTTSRSEPMAELRGAPEGQRRAVLTSEAGRLRVLGVSRAEAEAVLLELGRRCAPPVPEEHVTEILDWAWRKPAGTPRLCPICDGPEPCAEHRLEDPGRPSAEPRIVWLRDAVRGAIKELDAFHAGDLSDYVPTGIVTLDHKLGGGFRRRQVALLGAPTGGGKTTLLMGLAVAAASRGSVLFVTPEMAAAELALREVVRRSRVMKWVRRPWHPRPEPEREDAVVAHSRAASSLLAEDLAVAFMDQPAVTMADIEAAARSLGRDGRTGPSLVIIDYAQEVADADPRTPRYLTVGAVASRSVALAEEINAAVVIASQVNLVRDGHEESFAFRESAILSHKAHFVLELVVEWDKLPEGTRRVRGAKIRCTKARNASTFELPVNYRPELYLLTDEVGA